MNLIRKNIIAFGGLCLAVALHSCNSWNEVESKSIDYPNYIENNQEQYEKYLSKLIKYKESKHKNVYVWYDNSDKSFISRPSHMTNLPDSIDYIVLEQPDNLANQELIEMDEVKTKGTKVLYNVSFDAIRDGYSHYVEEVKKKEEEENVQIEIEAPLSYLIKYLQPQLRLADKYNYDGIIVSYVGKSLLHMDAEDVELYSDFEHSFIGLIKSWIKSHENRHVAFEGVPNHLNDISILEHCKHIIVHTHHAKDVNQIQYNLALANNGEIPNDRFIVTSQVPLNDPEDPQEGYWTSGVASTIGVSNWIAGDGYEKVVGIGIKNVKLDYYNSPRIYAYTAKTIEVLNPILK